jgi:GDP-D-mannose 3',5'-epimerase
MVNKKTALVLGVGFIGHHMVCRLKQEGYWVRGVDIKPIEYSAPCDEFVQGDLTDHSFVSRVMWGPGQSEKGMPGYFDEVYQFAADMGGAGYIFTGEHDANIMRNSALINLNVADIAVKNGVGKLFYSSSACMYPSYAQMLSMGSAQIGLKESDAYPANPDSEYGWEKLFSERLYLSYARNFELNVRIARFHNIYGPMGTWKGGKEKAPAAMIRKAIEAYSAESFMPQNSRIEVWGTGDQTRSFLYIDDCIDAVRLLMESSHTDPINIGSEESVTINELAWMAIDLTPSARIGITHIDGPVGVNGRNSDNTLIRQVLGWEPKLSLKEGMQQTYNWINTQYNADSL